MSRDEAEQLAERTSGWSPARSAELTRTYRTCDCSACYWRTRHIAALIAAEEAIDA